MTNRELKGLSDERSNTARADTTMAWHEDVRDLTFYLNMPRKRSRFSCRPARSLVARLQWSVPCHASWCELAWTIFISLDFRLAATFATFLPQSNQRKPNYQQRWGRRLRRCRAERANGQNAIAKPLIPNRYIGRNPTARNANCATKYLDAKRARI